MTLRSSFRILIILGLACTASALKAQTIFTINSLGDDPDNDAGDGVCSTGEVLGNPPPFVLECTLRAALEEANKAGEPVSIEVSQGIERTTPNLSVIKIFSALPYISNQVTIAGDTHPDWEQEGATHLVVQRAAGAGSFSGLRFSSGASGSTVRSIALQNFIGSGILLLSGNDFTIESNVLGGLWIPTTSSYLGNGSNGIDLKGASFSLIRDNLITANGHNGIRIRDGAASNVIQGNVIGLSRVTASDLYEPHNGNQGRGVVINSSAGEGNAIGFLSSNTIANNGSSGILIQADGQLVLGNRIGVAHDGEVAQGFESEDYGNGLHGIQITGSDNTIGAAGAGRNVIGHSQTAGIDLTSDASNNEIAFNWIGTDPDGADLGMSHGIQVSSGDDNLIVDNDIAFNSRGIYMSGGFAFIHRNTIIENGAGVQFQGPGQLGSPETSDANVIGNNGVGIVVFSSSPGLVAIRNNYIGTDASGASLGNTAGVNVIGPDSTVWIGQNDGAGNIIANSTSSGINLRQGASGVIIAGNLIGIHSNGQPMGNRIGIGFGNASGSNATNNRVGYGVDDTIDPGSWMPGIGASNVIAHNEAGISFERADDNSTGNVIRGNSIHSNGPASTRGIDLGMKELDSGGATSGPNSLMNYPDFDPAATEYDAGSAEINYRVRVQTTPANADYPLTIDFYLTDGSSPQGKAFIGSVEYPTSAAFEFRTGTLSVNQPVNASTYLVATATDSSGNTSQFSNQPSRLIIPEDALFSDRFEGP